MTRNYLFAPVFLLLAEFRQCISPCWPDLDHPHVRDAREHILDLTVGLPQVWVVDEMLLLDHLLRALELVSAQSFTPATEGLPLAKPDSKLKRVLHLIVETLQRCRCQPSAGRSLNLGPTLVNNRDSLTFSF